MATARWSVRALRDLRNLVERLADTSESYAGALAARIISAIETLERFPMSGRTVPEYSRTDTREVIISDQRVVYIVKDDIVLIAGIVSARRNLIRTLGSRPWDMN